MSDALFPPLEPYAAGWLEAGDGHRVWHEQSGNPRGAPVVFLHGGPGSSTNPDHRRFFDPAFYRIVLVDQRGCGRSTPSGEVGANTTAHLVDDLERVRLELGVERWLLFGGSWGSTLALAYAQMRPAVVSGLVLRGLFLASHDEVDWFVTGLRRFLPEAWSAFAGEVDDRSCAGLLRHYHERVAMNDVAAAGRWNAWESAVMAVGEAPSASAAPASAATLARVRIQLHYLVNGCFLAAGQLLRGLERLAQLPAILVQGRRDLACPPGTAYTVARRWAGARLRLVEEAGHSAMHPAMARALVQATQDIKALVAPT
ncbi:MAG TPA: prolyl aminopeptidase [Burkholderiales bacterium]|nr:prolyl aminopeptidase [Burkholderiales bacterium]